MPEWIGDPPHPPSIFLLHWLDRSSAGGQRLSKNRVRIRHRQDHPHEISAACHWTDIAVFRGFVTHPELGSIHRKSRHHTAVGTLEPKDLVRSEGQLVELNSPRATPHREPRRNRATKRTTRRRIHSHDRHRS